MGRARKIRKLGDASDPEAVLPELIEAAKDEDRTVREAAMLALEKLPLDTTAYLAAGLQDEDGWVRLRAACGLAGRGDARGRSVLRSLAESDDYDACVLALFGLGAIGDEDALLAAMLNPGSGPAVREVVVRALQPTQSDQSRRIREAAFNDENRFVRRAAREAFDRSERTTKPLRADGPH